MLVLVLVIVIVLMLVIVLGLVFKVSDSLVLVLVLVTVLEGGSQNTPRHTCSLNINSWFLCAAVIMCTNFAKYKYSISMEEFVKQPTVYRPSTRFFIAEKT